MAFTMNVCPTCAKVITEDMEYIPEDESMACPYCGVKESYSFWDVQNIELYIAIQGGRGLVEAGEMHTKRIKEKNEKKV